jgi:aryl-alcohol dehydrogenase-like predicted oxidoreductase
MRSRPLGPTGLSVSALGLGTRHASWLRDPAEADRALDAFVAAGGTLLDTSPAFAASPWEPPSPHNPAGAVEELLGRWLRERRGLRRELVVSTKVGVRQWGGRDGGGLGPEHVRLACDASLKRLRVDELDVLYFEGDPDAPAPQLVGLASELVRKGKVRAWGLFEPTVERVRETASLAKALGESAPSCVMVKSSLVEPREPGPELAKACRDAGAALITYGPLAAGFLAGSYPEHAEPPPRARSAEALAHATQTGYRALQALSRLARERDVTPAAMAMAWQLARPFEPIACVAGARTSDQVQDLARGASIALERSEREELEALARAIVGD